MASARQIRLSKSDGEGGIYHVSDGNRIREDSAKTASEVLQEDMERHHVFFNERGFHNHIVHHILTIYALGASPEKIKLAYEHNKNYQRAVYATSEEVVRSLSDKDTFKKCLGQEKNYANFLAFFQNEIESKGVETVLTEHLFGNEAEGMFVRLFAGLLHPIIHLGFGIEFNQPAIIAEALAQTAVHGDWIGSMFLFPAEQAAGGAGQRGGKTMKQILDEMRADKKIVDSARWGDGMRDGVLKRAQEELARHAGEFRVSEDELEEKLVEMINTVVACTSAAQRPSKEIKFDFFLIHGVNSSIFFAKFIHLSFVPRRTLARLLEWMGRMNIFIYAMCGLPQVHLDEIRAYPITNDWNTIFSRSIANPDDDGHLSKLARAVAHGERICKRYESEEKGNGGEKGLLVSGDEWLRIGNMAIDSVRNGHNMWIRLAGFDEAWDGFEDRSGL